MKKIVEAFDPETGQVKKDEHGQLKVQVVIDWPISTGLLGGKEYNNFFECADHLNNYHPEVTDVTIRIEGLKLNDYHPLRYQTKTYDERVSSLNVFCQQEKQFLETYRWLSQLPEFFKPRELFSVMEDSQAQDEVEKLLKNFEIDKEKIYCTDASTLQALFPYVKRLLHLFPETKQNTKHALSADGVRSRVYQIETRRYVERIGQSPLEFKADALSLRDLVRSDHQQVLHLRMVDGEEWSGIIKVHQILQKTDCLSEGQYTVLKLERLLTMNMFIDFSKLMQSTVTPYLLLMSCERNHMLDEEAKEVTRKIFDTIKHKPNIKIVLSTRSEGTTLPSLQQIVMKIFDKAFVTRDEQINWSDITTESQKRLLEKSVKFQGAKISLSEIICAESSIVNLPPLGALQEEKEIKIADPVPISNGYNKDYYIGRTLRRQQSIKEDIVWDKCIKKIPDLLVRTEEEFGQFSHNNPKSSVHWLQEDKSGKLLWQKSRGSLEKLREYIDTECSHRYTADDLDNLLEQAVYRRVMLISDKAGMGKSTVLTHLSKQIKQKFPAKWVVRIDLNDHTETLETLKREEIDREKAIEFVLEELLKLKPGLEVELFKECCEQKQKVRTVIMLDGFDEIIPFYKQSLVYCKP
jgi:hypothetical protein